MHKYKVFLSLLLILAFPKAYSIKAPDVIKKVLKATKPFETYEIRYQKQFKFQSERDTIKETYHSVISRTDIEYHVGTHHIYSTSPMVRKSAVAINRKEVSRVNYKDSMFFTLRLADDEKKAINSIQGHIYHPLSMYQEDFEGYELIAKEGNYIRLQKVDTVKDGKQKVKVINKTILSINEDTWIPEMEESWATFRTGGQQYSKYKLLSFIILPNKAYDRILKSADSLLGYIHTFIDGDALKNSRKQLYRTVKIGDSARVFKAIMQGKNTPYDVSSFKDSIVILDFFYTTCAPCIAAIPELNAFYAANRSRGVRVFGINPFESDWANLDQFVEDRHVAYPILRTDKTPVYEYGVTGYPRLFIIKNGIIVKIYYGFTRGLDKDLQKQIDELLK